MSKLVTLQLLPLKSSTILAVGPRLFSEKGLTCLKIRGECDQCDFTCNREPYEEGRVEAAWWTPNLVTNKLTTIF